MEKQNFLMEIMDIMNGHNNKDLVVAVEILIKEAIRVQARGGGKQFNIPSEAMHININGAPILVNKKMLESLTDNLREEGFEIVNQGNGYYNLSW